MTDVLVIGSGPAGLMAAEALAGAGLSVTLADAKPSFGRKLLMAGKSGLNLTMAESAGQFCTRYHDGGAALDAALAAFGPAEVQDWAQGLGQTIFTGSSGRVFPEAMKASPLLRAWLARLSESGVKFRTRWRWVGLDDGIQFDTPEGPQTLTPVITVLALGGASWSRLGSDGAWADLLVARGVGIAPFQPSNMGFRVDWSDHMARHFGSPVKGVALEAGGARSRGEFVVSKRGLEGGGIYAVSRPMRQGAPLVLDLLPDVPADKLIARLSRPRGKESLSNVLRKAGLDPVRIALLREFSGALSKFPEILAQMIKALRVRHSGPRPLDEAISTEGGVQFDAMDDRLMLRALPGIFCAGEMLDWDAPTGGYLITGCLATGRHAGRAAAAYVRDIAR